MSKNYCISVGLDYRTDGSDHEVEINYWDSDDNEARGIAKGESFEDAANHSYMNMLENLTPQLEAEEESRDEYIAELESWLSEAEESRDALLDENDRLEHRIQDLQKQLADFQKDHQDWYGKNIVTDIPQAKYDKSINYSYATSSKSKKEESVDQFIELLQKLGLF